MGARREWALLQHHRLPRSSLASPSAPSETSLYPQRTFSVNKSKESATHAGPSTGGSSLQPCHSPHLLLALGRGQSRWPSQALCVPGAFCGLHSGLGINPQQGSWPLPGGPASPGHHPTPTAPGWGAVVSTRTCSQPNASVQWPGQGRGPQRAPGPLKGDLR